MFKQYQKGGQRRTIEAPCGWRCVGHPQEVNKKYLLHRKYCKEGCKEITTDIPEFNKEAGLMNGWKGITNRNQQPNQMLTTALVDGERYDIFTNANTLEKSMEDTRLLANLMAENILPAPALSKSQKKRQKQKAKKLNDHLKAVEEHTCDPDCDCKNLGKAETDEELAKLMEAERIANGGNPNCPCCIITADRIVRENIEGTDYCRIIIKDRK